MTLKTLNIRRRNTGAAFNASNPHNRPWREYWLVRSRFLARSGKLIRGVES